MTTIEQPLVNRTILITGASRGIGRGVALACAEAGATTLLCGRDVPALEAIAESAEQQGFPAPVLVPVNLERATADDYAQISGLIETQFGRLDGLVLNAAMVGEISPLAHLDGATWARVFQVNLHANFLLLRACLELVSRATEGTVLFTLAGAHATGKANWGAYGVSQRALQGLFELFAAECGTGDPVSAIALVPPALNTRLRRHIFPGAGAEEYPQPEQIAHRYVEYLHGPARLENHARQIDLT